jgi:tetratricopeptide (TPR) repeat protein
MFWAPPAYMAPEQCSGDSRPTDRRADVYGLGVTLYEALTGTRPFAGATREAILHAVRSSIFPPLRRTAPELPRDLEVVVHTAMNFEPTLRYETALAFAEDLRRVRDWEPILAEPPSVLGRIGRWSKRHPARAALIALIGIGTPTLAALGGYIAATAPRVAAQERTERARDFENEVESGFFDLAHHSLESAHTHFESALALVRRYPESGSAIEAELGRILVLRRGNRIAEAQAAWRTLRVDIGDPGLIAAMETELSLTPAADAAAGSAGMLRPTTSLGHFMVATLALASGHENERERDANRHFQRARDHYLAAILQSDRARRAHHTGLADATSHLAMEVEARELSDTLLSLWPNDPQVTYAAGHALVNVDPKRAAAQLEQAVLNLPDASHAAFALGDARRKLGDASGAVAAYELGLTRQATYPNAWAALALAHLAQKEAERAESAIRRALELAPYTPGFDSILAKTFDMRRDDAAAAAILVASLDRHPEDWRNRHTLGQAFRRLDRSEDAARELLLAAQHPQASAECLINTGLAIQECGRPIEATPYLVRGHELGSARPTWNYPSGQWLEDNRRYAAQDRHFSERLAEATNPETLDIEDRELVHFNEWALFTRRPDVGLRFYRELFRNRPILVAKEAYRATLVLLVHRGATFSITNPYVRTPKLATLSDEDRREALGWLEAMVDQWESPAENMEPFPDSIPETAAWLGDETAFQALRDGGESQLDSALQARTAALWARISAAAEKK